MAASIEVLGGCKLPAPSRSQKVVSMQKAAPVLALHWQGPFSCLAGSSHLAAVETTEGKVGMRRLARTRGQMGGGTAHLVQRKEEGQPAGRRTDHKGQVQHAQGDARQAQLILQRQVLSSGPNQVGKLGLGRDVSMQRRQGHCGRCR